MAARFATKGLRSDCCKLIANIRLYERTMFDAFCLELRDGSFEPWFVLNATENQMRVFCIGRDKRAGSLNGCVTSLNGLLRGVQVLADKNVNVLVFLRVLHRFLLG